MTEVIIDLGECGEILVESSTEVGSSTFDDAREKAGFGSGSVNAYSTGHCRCAAMNNLLISSPLKVPDAREAAPEAIAPLNSFPAIAILTSSKLWIEQVG